jgi:hypothetical protein
LEVEGCVVNASLEAAKAVIANVLDVAAESDPDDADKVRPVAALVMLRPVKVATPFTALTVAVPDNVPALTASVTDAVDVVALFPNSSCTVTTGCDANALPAAVEADGCVVNANFDADAAVIANVLEVAAVSDPDVADRVRPVPAVVALNPLNVATPLTAFTVAEPDNVPVLMLRVTGAFESVTVLPKVSCTVTTGCAVNAVPATVDDDGCVENASFTAAADVTVVVEAAERVWSGALAVVNVRV